MSWSIGPEYLDGVAPPPLQQIVRTAVSDGWRAETPYTLHVGRSGVVVGSACLCSADSPTAGNKSHHCRENCHVDVGVDPASSCFDFIQPSGPHPPACPTAVLPFTVGGTEPRALRSARCPGLTLAYYRLALCLLAARGAHASRQARLLLDCAMFLEGAENRHLSAAVDLVLRILR